MLNRLRALQSIIQREGGQSTKLRRRLILYLCSMILVFFLAGLLVLSLVGVLPVKDKKFGEVLNLQQQSAEDSVLKQFETMASRGISLSEEVSEEVEDLLSSGGRTYESIDNDPKLILEMEERFYTSLRAVLDVKYCSGAFIMIDATVNTAAQQAETSRMAVYLRFSDVKDINTYNQHVVYFRGMPEVARKKQIQLHNRWNMEMDITQIPGYRSITEDSDQRLGERCYWTERSALPETWEDVVYVCVPILDSTGKVRGICGLEISDLYFSLSHGVTESAYGNMVTAVAPVNNGSLFLDKGILGDSEGTFLSEKHVLKISSAGHYDRYDDAQGNYLGKHREIAVRTANNLPMAVVTLVEKSSYDQMVMKDRLFWMMGLIGFLALSMMLAIYLSRRFVQPIEKSINAISGKQFERTGISEIDALLDLVAASRNQKLDAADLPLEVSEMLSDFVERVETLTPMERIVLNHYIDGDTIKTLAELECISIGTARKHNTNINRKLGTTTHEELLLYIDIFKRCGWIDRIYKQ